MPNPNIQFCLNFNQERPLHEVAKWWKACDDAGIQMVGIPDSPAIFRELYVSATLCAMSTSRIRVLIAVTNPTTRHPSVTAGALSSIEELAPGRIALGIGTGDSSIWGVGLKPASIGSLKEYILAVKGLIQGEDVNYRGKTFKSEWSSRLPTGDISIYVACSGPKILKMASQVADGLIITMGFAPEDIQHVRNVIKEGCAEVGRDPDDLHIWWNASVTFAPSVEKAMENTLGWNLSWLTMGSLEGKGIPEMYKAPLLEMNADCHNLSAYYKMPERGRALVERAKKLGLHDWIISRSPRLYGTPGDVTNRLMELARMGLTNWIFYVPGPDLDRFDLIDKLSKGVMPNLA